MGREYGAELRELGSTYLGVQRAGPDTEVCDAVRSDRPTIYVGSGGALAVARLAADLHIRSTGHLAVAMTPLEAATATVSPDTGLVLFSARGRNPDAALAVMTARLRGASHLGVVTAVSRNDLPTELGSNDVRVGTVRASADGFLATNSLLAMAAAICLAHGAELPAHLPAFDSTTRLSARRESLVLTGPGTTAVGLDIEARLAETGLSAVQLADYRNLAHGRHVGLSRNIESTTVVAVVDAATEAIANRTLSQLPVGVDIVRLESPLRWPASVLDLLVISMQFTSNLGEQQGINPGRPGVQPFGRALYHLPIRKLVDVRAPSPIARKVHDFKPITSAAHSLALDAWLLEMRETRFRGIALDYDGTCCATSDRFAPPPEHIQRELIRLLDLGVSVGFATGRGRSLLDATRTWLPHHLWARVVVGLYNGTHMMRLSDDPPAKAEPEGDLKIMADRIKALGLDDLQVESRKTQVSVVAKNGRTPGFQLLPLVRSVLGRDPALACKAVASGHSVDLIALDAGKVAVLEAVSAEAGGAVLAIGDQGQIDGNDYELLAARSTTLSVDRCSADPTRCWNLDRWGHSGPDLLAKYLKALRFRSSGMSFVWRLE